MLGTRGAQQDKFYRIQYSLAPIIVYGQKNRFIMKNIVKYSGSRGCTLKHSVTISEVLLDQTLAL